MRGGLPYGSCPGKEGEGCLGRAFCGVWIPSSLAGGDHAPESQSPWLVPGGSQPDRARPAPGAGRWLDVSHPHPPTESSATLAAFTGPRSVDAPLACSYRCLSRDCGCVRAGRMGEGEKGGPAQHPKKTPASLAGSCCRRGGVGKRGSQFVREDTEAQGGEVGYSPGGRLSPALSPVCIPRALPTPTVLGPSCSAQGVSPHCPDPVRGLDGQVYLTRREWGSHA